MDLFTVHANATNQWRQRVLLETLIKLRTPELRKEKLEQALLNLERWRRDPVTVDLASHYSASWRSSSGKVFLLQGDWGDVTQDLTKQYGKTFVVLNMAHAKSPGGGGGYVHGTPAQEENMFHTCRCIGEFWQTYLLKLEGLHSISKRFEKPISLTTEGSVP